MTNSKNIEMKDMGAEKKVADSEKDSSKNIRTKMENYLWQRMFR